MTSHGKQHIVSPNNSHFFLTFPHIPNLPIISLLPLARGLLKAWGMGEKEQQITALLSRRAARRLSRHFNVEVHRAFFVEIHCSRSAFESRDECKERFHQGCVAHYFAYQWCAFVVVNRSTFWDCYLQAKAALSGGSAESQRNLRCTHPLVCHSCAVLAPITFLFGLYAYIVRRFREFACCLVFLSVVVCMGPYQLPPCDNDPCSATTSSEYLSQPCAFRDFGM